MIGRGAIIFAWVVTSLTAAAQTQGDYPHPTISENGSWIGVVWLIIGGLILAAAVIGPIVRANLPEEELPAHSHMEPPGVAQTNRNEIK